MISRKMAPHSFLIVASFMLLSCASYTEETREMRGHFRTHSYASALAAIEKSSIKEQPRNRLLYSLEKAIILDRMAERKRSRKLLMDADRIADELYTVSISKTAASFVVNDGATDYGGEDYEKVAIHLMLALSFIEDRDYKSALVSARKINTKLHEINQSHEDSPNNYAEDAFARYLSGLIFEADGQFDDAIIDYRKALKLYQGSYGRFYVGSVPESLVTSLYGLVDKRKRKSLKRRLEKDYPRMVTSFRRAKKKHPDRGELIVIHEAKSIAVKTNEEFVVPMGKQIIRFSFPVIRRNWSAGLGRTGVNVGSDKYYQAENVQDMDAIAKQTLDDRRGRMLIKGAARLLAKGQLTDLAYQKLGPLGGLAANIYSAVSETGDTRSWTLLPQAFFVTRISLKPGQHKIAIKTAGRTSQLKTVKIKKNKLLILRDF